MAIGRTGSYGFDKPLEENYIGQALSETENQGFKYRQEQRLAEEKKKAKEEAIDEENAKILGYLKNPTTTKFATQNALTIDGATKLFNGVAEKAQELKRGKISKLDYDIYKANAMGQMDLMNQANKRINAQGEEYAKQLADGKISPVFADNALSFGKAFQDNNIHFELNPDGTLKAFAYDDPKNPSKIIEKGDLSTFGNYSFTPIANYDIDKDITEFKKTYPPVLTEKLQGNQKIGIEGITPEIKKAIDLKVNSLIADKNSLAVANAQRPGGNVNPNVEDPKDIEATKKFLEERYLNAYSPKTTVDEAYQGANYRLSARKQAKEEQKDEVVHQVITTPPIYAENKITPAKGFATVSIANSKPTTQTISVWQNVTRPAVDKKGNEIKGKTVTKPERIDLKSGSILSSYTIKRLPNGNPLIMAEIKVPVYKNKSIKEGVVNPITTTEVPEYQTRIVPLTANDAVHFMKSAGFNNVHDMVKAAQVGDTEEEQPKETLAEKMRRLAGKK